MSYQFPGKLISYDSYTATAGGDEEAQYSDYVMKTGMHWAFIPPEEWTARPARKQADPPSGPQTLPENWNIWYHKAYGDYEKRGVRKDPIPADTRVDPQNDCGMTSAHASTGYICVHFAHGRCIYGVECKFLHRMPTLEDEQKLDTTKDIFGRDRHGTDKEDMSGTGSFSRHNTTLWVAGIVRPKEGWEGYRRIIYRHFGAFGPIANIRILQKIGTQPFMFLTFEFRASAEMAKECMQNQAMDNNEILVIRWASQDPNPQAMELERIKKIQSYISAAARVKRFRQEQSAKAYAQMYTAYQAQALHAWQVQAIEWQMQQAAAAAAASASGDTETDGEKKDMDTAETGEGDGDSGKDKPSDSSLATTMSVITSPDGSVVIPDPAIIDRAAPPGLKKKKKKPKPQRPQKPLSGGFVFSNAPMPMDDKGEIQWPKLYPTGGGTGSEASAGAGTGSGSGVVAGGARAGDTDTKTGPHTSAPSASGDGGSGGLVGMDANAWSEYYQQYDQWAQENPQEAAQDREMEARAAAAEDLGQSGDPEARPYGTAAAEAEAEAQAAVYGHQMDPYGLGAGSEYEMYTDPSGTLYPDTSWQYAAGPAPVAPAPPKRAAPEITPEIAKAMREYMPKLPSAKELGERLQKELKELQRLPAPQGPLPGPPPAPEPAARARPSAQGQTPFLSATPIMPPGLGPDAGKGKKSAAAKKAAEAKEKEQKAKPPAVPKPPSVPPPPSPATAAKRKDGPAAGSGSGAREAGEEKDSKKQRTT